MEDTLTLDQKSPQTITTIRPNSQSGRDATTGRFTAGNKMSVGHSSTARKNLLAFRQFITEQEIAELAQMLLTHAKKGDIRAAQIILDYALPRPNEIVRIDDRNEREVEDEKRRHALIANIGRTI